MHAVVTGKVQGVFFRDSTRKKAKQLNLTGWVKNCPDGSVELTASGERENVLALADWLWQGAPASEVADVNWSEVPLQNFDDFVILR